MPVLVSVIITTKNEEKNIENCLISIKNQSYPFDLIEIIVVDNNSEDKTKEIARKHTEKVFNYGPERSVQRNLGVKQAQGKYIVYLDADMTLSKDVIKECVQKCEDEGTIALYIPEEIIGKGFLVKVRNFERSFYNATCVDAVRFVRLDKFLEINGFDENLTGPEDWDFDKRIKTVGITGIITAPIYHNEGQSSLKKYVSKKSYYAKSFDKYVQKWGRNDPVIKKQLGFLYRYFGVFFEMGKWRMLISNPLSILGMYFLRLMVGLSYLQRRWFVKKKHSNTVTVF